MRQSTIKRLAIQQEANIKECKICKSKKLRILAGKYPKMNNKYVDEQGLLWCGKICPPCNQLRIKAKMQEMRAGRKNTPIAELTRAIEQSEIKKEE